MHEIRYAYEQHNKNFSFNQLQLKLLLNWCRKIKETDVSSKSPGMKINKNCN